MEFWLPRIDPRTVATDHCDGRRFCRQSGWHRLCIRSGNRLRALDLCRTRRGPNRHHAGKRGPEGTPTAYFGDIIANLYAVDANTGELIWQTSPDEHHSATLTGTPAFANGNLYVPVSSLEVVTAANPDYACCTFRGHVMAVDGNDGSMLWDSYAIPDAPSSVGTTSVGTDMMGPSGAPVWTSPTIDVEKNLLIFGTGKLLLTGRRQQRRCDRRRTRFRRAPLVETNLSG